MKNKKILIAIIILLTITAITEGIIIITKNQEKKDEKNKTETQNIQNIEEKATSTPKATATPKVTSTPKITPTPEATDMPNTTNVPEDEEITVGNINISKKYHTAKSNEVVYTFLDAQVIDSENTFRNGSNLVPQFNLDSDDAKEFNNDILDIYQTNIEDYIKENKFTNILFYNLRYKYYENGDILSLVLRAENEAQPYYYFKVFNINKTTGKRVSNDELLEYKKLLEEDFRKKVNNSIENLEMYNSEFADSEFTQKQKQNTVRLYDLSGKKISEYDLYIGNNGALMCYLRASPVTGGEDAVPVLVNLDICFEEGF